MKSITDVISSSGFAILLLVTAGFTTGGVVTYYGHGEDFTGHKYSVEINGHPVSEEMIGPENTTMQTEFSASEYESLHKSLGQRETTYREDAHPPAVYEKVEGDEYVQIDGHYYRVNTIHESFEQTASYVFHTVKFGILSILIFLAYAVSFG